MIFLVYKMPTCSASLPKCTQVSIILSMKEWHSVECIRPPRPTNPLEIRILDLLICPNLNRN